VLILLEGLDGTGKSTVADELRSVHGFEVFHQLRPKDPPVWTYTAPLFGYYPGQGRHVVCDRWHLSETVYPRSLGHRTELTATGLGRIERFLSDKGAVVVYCLASVETICTSHAIRGEPIDLDRIERETLYYDESLSETRLPVAEMCLDRTIRESYRDLRPYLDLALREERSASVAHGRRW